MGVLDPVVLGFGAGRVAGQASPLPEMLETFGPTGQDLVDIGLVAGVEDDRIVRRVEDSVNAQGEFDDAKVRAQVPTGARLVSWRRESVRRSRGPPISVSKDMADSLEALSMNGHLVALPRQTVLRLHRDHVLSMLDLSDEHPRYWILRHWLPTRAVRVKN